MDARLEAQLVPFFRDRRRYRLWGGLAICWGIGVIVLGTLALLDYWVGWWSPGIWLSTISLTALAALAHLVRTLIQPFNVRRIAGQIEADFPKLNSLLLAAVEQEPHSQTGEYHYLQRRVIQEALDHSRKIFWRQHEITRLMCAHGAHWVSLGLFLALCLATPVIAPFGPRASSFAAVAVSPGDTQIERGSSLAVVVRFNRHLPGEATLIATDSISNSMRFPLTKNLSDPIFGGTIPSVTNDLVYRIEYDGHHSRGYRVTTFSYPRLEQADAHLKFPAYTGLADKIVPDTRRISAVEGSKVDWTFRLNKAVVRATLTGTNGSSLALVRDPATPNLYHAHLDLKSSNRYELGLVDQAGRTNRIPPHFTFDIRPNRRPQFRLLAPPGDQEVSSLEEVQVRAESWDDFGLKAYGLSYTIAGQAPREIKLGGAVPAQHKQSIAYLLRLEKLKLAPHQLLTFSLWAEDLGPDGNLRRSASDLHFLQVRPFDRVYRESQQSSGPNSSNASSGRSPTQQSIQLQKQIVNATWNIQRREPGPKPTPHFAKDIAVVESGQDQALQQLRSLRQRAGPHSAQAAATADKAEKAMTSALDQLRRAHSRNSLTPLAPALEAEQAALQALFAAQSAESRVSRSRSTGSSQALGSRQQRQLDLLDLKDTADRYETARQAADQSPVKKAQVETLNRLRELAQRQNDLNRRLQELQTALQAAQTEPERNRVRDELKRLREDQQKIVRDLDQLRQQMSQSNDPRLARELSRLDRTRSEMQRTMRQMDQRAVSQALASGTRAQRQLQQMRDKVQRQSASQFADAMRQMRATARDLQDRQNAIHQKMQDLAQQGAHTLDDGQARRALAAQLEQQGASASNLLQQVRKVTEQAENSEPLLSRDLYDTLRKTEQSRLQESLQKGSQWLQKGFINPAQSEEKEAGKDIAFLKQGIDRAAERVLGSELDSLKLAQRELDSLRRQVEEEMKRAATNRLAAADRSAPAPSPSSPTSPGQRNAPGNRRASATSPNGGNQRTATHSRSGQRPRDSGQSTSSSARTRRYGLTSAPGPRRVPSASSPAPAGSGPLNQLDRPSRGGASRTGSDTQTASNQGNRGLFFNQWNRGGAGNNRGGPLTGSAYSNWRERLRDVEQLMDNSQWRDAAARIGDEARTIRQQYKQLNLQPQWSLVRSRIVDPMTTLHDQIGEKILREESPDALVPIDRDPVPQQYADLVRRYYERLGSGKP